MYISKRQIVGFLPFLFLSICTTVYCISSNINLVFYKDTINKLYCNCNCAWVSLCSQLSIAQGSLPPMQNTWNNVTVKCPSFVEVTCVVLSASARISKGQEYQVFLHVRKRAGSSFGQKRAICVIQGKTWKTNRISLLLGSIICFPLSFNTFKTL
jgi:hypothetical protein